MTAKRVDANHGEIVQCYKELFCSVVDLHEQGFGCPDLLIGCAGRSELVEVKGPDGELEPSQLRFNAEWRGNKPLVVRTRDDVIAHVKKMRVRAAGGLFSSGA